MTVQKLRPLEPALASIPALARLCTLAFVRTAPLAGEYGPEAAAALSDACFGRRLLVKYHGKDPRTPDVSIVSLVDPDTGACVNEDLIVAGLGRVSKNEARRARKRTGGGAAAAASASAGGGGDLALLERLEAAQAASKVRRVGLYAYGDPADSDDEKR